ncbi:hypothetical protein ABW636_12020 [Aquimarina sp. 2201CG1-2-11]|uniref:hypothetical protein n=1 Tax=Aquimarina discodermiae TaxID=3231043 RepID=UPI0034619C7B
MEKQITIKNDYNSLDKILEFVKNESSYECSKDYDKWDMRTDTNGQMETCVVIKKNALHGVKVYLPHEKSLKMTHIVPNVIMNAYLGKNQQRHRRIDEIVIGKIKDLLLLSSQKKAFKEFEELFKKIEIV